MHRRHCRDSSLWLQQRRRLMQADSDESREPQGPLLLTHHCGLASFALSLYTINILVYSERRCVPANESRQWMGDRNPTRRA